MKPRILVTPRSVTTAGHSTLEKLRAAGYEIIFCTPGVQPSEEELCALLPGCVGYLAGIERVSARALERATELRVISRNGAGLDNIDIAAARARGIVVISAAGANARGVAELTIGYLLALARRVAELDASLKCGKWERHGPGVELEGKSVGIVGYGNIGKLVATLARALGMRVIVHDSATKGNVEEDGIRMTTFYELLTAADFVTLHCPAAADGRALLDASTIARMKRGAWIINTARRNLVDSGALFAGLESGHVAAAAVDVLAGDCAEDLALAVHPRVIATPHIGGFTHESIDRAMAAAVDNLLHALRQI